MVNCRNLGLLRQIVIGGPNCCWEIDTFWLAQRVSSQSETEHLFWEHQFSAVLFVIGKFFILTFKAKHHLVQAQIEFFRFFFITKNILNYTASLPFESWCSALGSVELEFNPFKERTSISLFPHVVRWDYLYSFKHL